MFILELLTIYAYLLYFFYTTTVLLILLDYSWGPLPHLCLRLIERIQEEFEKVYPETYFERLPWKGIIEGKTSVLECHDCRLSDYEIVDDQVQFPFNTHVNLIRSGIEAIIQDEFSSVLDFAPDYQKYELSWNLWRFLDNKLLLRGIFFIMVAIRIFILFPVRLALYLTSFGFLSTCCVLACFIQFSTRSKLWVTRRYCRLYTAATGLIAFFYNEENKPRPPGIIVSNHLSANDIMVLCQDVDQEQNFVYSVTGQKHMGIIWFIQNLVSKLISTMWLERSIAQSRLKFLKEVLDAAKENHLVLMFPEGYCSNGNKVMQFRRAVFDKDIQIWPIAIRQDSRFGDAFWREQQFVTYIVRILTSFATVYHIYYLPPQQARDHEKPEEFAARVQSLISKVCGSPTIHFGGNIYYKASDREKYRNCIKKMCASEVLNEASSPVFVPSGSDTG